MHKKIFNITNLCELTNIVHDKWFMIDEVKNDTCKQLLELPFYINNPYKKKESTFGILIFRKVKDVLLIDNEQIGSYDFNKIVYNQKKKIVHIKTNFPLTLDVTVDESNFEIITLLCCISK